MTHYPILIAGAGLGGLTLANTLRANGIPATLLDAEASRAARTQGGMLDIHAESGQAALHAAGLYEPFTRLIHRGGEETRVLDRHGVVRWSHPDDGAGERPEVDRGRLRELLLDALPADAVVWGAKVTGARPLGGGRHAVDLADGTTVTTDLLVGADGAWSRVRPLLSAATPAYSGISFVELDIPDVDARHPGCSAVVGGGMLFALGHDRAFFAHRDTHGGAHVYVALRVPLGWTAALDITDLDATKTVLYNEFPGWDDSVLALITEAEGQPVPREIHALPVEHRWERTPGVTLLGDAAHLMSPFAGEGANLAMFDGAQLGTAIAAHAGDTEAALAAYERDLFPRSTSTAALTAENMGILFREDAPAGIVEQFAA